MTQEEATIVEIIKMVRADFAAGQKTPRHTGSMKHTLYPPGVQPVFSDAWLQGVRHTVKLYERALAPIRAFGI